MAKVLIVITDRPNLDSMFVGLKKDGHEVVYSVPEDALVNLAVESPNILICLAEYADRLSRKYKVVEQVFEDIKRSLGSNQKLIRMGFQPPRDKEGETYVELPISEENLRELIGKLI